MKPKATRAAPDPRPSAETPPLVDLGRPLLAQVAALGPNYDAWVHKGISPRAAAAANDRPDSCQPARWQGSLRIFQSTFWESMSHIPWWLVPLVWIPIVSGLFAVATVHFGVPLGTAAWVFAGGAFTWTLVEYVLHRVVFHYIPRSGLGIRLHFLAHGIHHLDPWDGTRLVFPPVAGIGVATGLFFLTRLALPLDLTCAFMSGLLLGYITYDMTHYFTHHGKPRGRWGRFVRGWHLAHHHKHWTAMYGVSQPLWDFVFRTGRPAGPPSDAEDS